MKQHFRVGFGYDVHRLVEGKKLILGGVLVSQEIGPVAHSDGDVLLHAICDALLGAAALGDIGVHFPDSDEQYRNIAGLELLRRVHALLKDKGFVVGNIDATVILERPKIMSHAARIRENISRILFIDSRCVSIKATTSEGLGFVGEGKGVVAHAIALISSGA